MESLIQFPRRATRVRVCMGCGERLPPGTPAHHRNCRKCWNLGQYRRAVFEFLEAARPRQ